MGIIQNLYDSPHLLDILIEFENLIDNIGMYAYTGWMDGEIINGPIIKKYYITVWVRYESMPDPAPIRRMMIKKFITVMEPETKGDKDKNKPWIVKVSVPKSLFSSLSLDSFQDYAEDIDVDAVTDAVEDGVVNTSNTAEEDL